MTTHFITSSLLRGGAGLFDHLIERCQQLAQTNDNPMYRVLWAQLREARNEEKLRGAIMDALAVFASQSDPASQLLSQMDNLFRYATGERESFTQNWWRYFLFGSERVRPILWEQYEDIYHAAHLDGVQLAVEKWGQWVIPTRNFIPVLEDALINTNEVFRQLLASETLLDLIEDLPGGEDEQDFDPHAAGLRGDIPFDEMTLGSCYEAIVRTIGQADPRQVYRSSQTAIPLGDVYIPMQLVRLGDHQRPLNLVRYQTAFDTSPALNAFHTPAGQDELDALPNSSLSEVLDSHQQFLVLGDEGTGKTTLLRYIALQHARLLSESKIGGLIFETSADGDVTYRLMERFPIYVDLAQFLELHHDDESLHRFAIRTVYELTCDDAVPAMLESLIENGQCLFLLDGLDRAATAEQHQAIVGAVTDASRRWAEAGNQVVVSSRLEGYDASPLPASFACYLIRPFDRDDIYRFLYRWSRTLYRMQHPLSSDEDAQAKATAATQRLMQAINGNPRLPTLLNTPLLLRMLAEVYEPGMILTGQKAGLYTLIATALIQEWRLPKVAARRPAVLESEVVPLLGEMAYWLHSTRPTGMIHEQELHQILGHFWGNKHPDYSQDEIDAAIGEFIGSLRMHSGVLCELTPQHYGFVYQSLQEYFAARWMVSSFRQAPERIRKHLHDPRWNEIIALAIGYMALRSQEDATDLIESAIIGRGDRAVQFGQASSPFESRLKRDLLFTARLLGDGVDASDQTASWVAQHLMDLWLNGDQTDLGRFPLMFDAARRQLMSFDGMRAGGIAFEIAAEALDSRDPYVQAFAVDALTFWPSLEYEAQKVLTQLHDGPKSAQTIVQRATAQALLHARQLQPETYRLMIQFTGEVDEQVSETARAVLKRHQPVPEDMVRFWANLLNNGSPVDARVGLRRLREIAVLPESIVNEILRLLSNPDAATRRLAVETLAVIPNLSDEALTTIYRFISHADRVYKATAIRTFERASELPQQIVRQILRWTDDIDASVRMAAVGVLGACDNTGPDIVDALLDRVREASDSVRAAAMEPLVIKGRDNERVLHALIHAASDPIPEVRIALARALRHIREPDHNIQSVLNTLLSDSVMAVREAALTTISQLDSPGREVLNQLVGLVEMPEHPIKVKAITTLASLRDLPDWALLALVRSLYNYGETLGDEIIACLAAHAPLSVGVLHEVMDLAVLHDSRRSSSASTALRSYALEILGNSLDDSMATQRILVNALQAENSRVRVAAVRGLAHSREVPPDVLERLQTLLRSDQVDVRCVAGITLGHLIRNLPYLPFEGEELLNTARVLVQTLMDLPACAAWEPGSRMQNDVLQALSWVVARAHPTLPRLSAG